MTAGPTEILVTAAGTPQPGHVLVIGGGISGLAAALRLRDIGGPGLRITVVEGSPRLGGKIHTGDVAGAPVETGAESFLARRSEGLDLAARLGLTDSIRHPATVPASLAVDRQLRAMPKRTIMGVPGDLAAITDANVLTPQGVARLADEPVQDEPLLPPGEDVAVGALVRTHMGGQIVERLVDPLLGGVYAGRADDLSLEATIPALAAAARRHPSLISAAHACLPTAVPSPAPVFATIEGGLSRMVEAAALASGARIRRGLPVRELHRTPTGWRAIIGATRDPQIITADSVVMAVPARPAARLLNDTHPGAAAEIGVLDYASVALVTLALPGIAFPRSSGFLVPATEGHHIKAATFVGRKWPHLEDPNAAIVRMSIGRYGEEQTLQRDDDELAALAHSDLSEIVGMNLPTATEVRVNRWGGGLPQYGPGHLDRIRRARQALTDQPIALAGAAFDGVGIPACIASGQAAADTVMGAR